MSVKSKTISQQKRSVVYDDVITCFIIFLIKNQGTRPGFHDGEKGLVFLEFKTVLKSLQSIKHT